MCIRDRFSVAEQPIAAMGATARNASRDVPKVKGAATTQTTPVIQQVTVIQVSALLFTFIARWICSSIESRSELFSIAIGRISFPPVGSCSCRFCLACEPPALSLYLRLQSFFGCPRLLDEEVTRTADIRFLYAIHDETVWSKQQGNRAVRAMGSKMFAEAVQELVTLGYGVVKVEKPLTYRALKEMTK